MLFLCSNWNEKKLAKICLLQCKSNQYLKENFNVLWNVETNYPQKRTRNPLIEKTFILLRGRIFFLLAMVFQKENCFLSFLLKCLRDRLLLSILYIVIDGDTRPLKNSPRQINACQAIRERILGYGVNQILHPEGAYIWNATLNFHTNFQKLANVLHEFSIQYFLVRDRLYLNWPPKKCYLKILACWKIN